MSLKALVLCAGRGTRLKELTKECPKPLLSIEGKPLVEYTLRHLASHEICDVAINLHYQAERIREALGDGSRFGIRIRYEIEDELLGTAGAVENLAAYFADASDILVVYGDLLFDEDLSALYDQHRSSNADITLLVHRRHTRSNSIIDMDESGRIFRFRERPSTWSEEGPAWVNSGCQILRRELIDLFPKRRPLDLPRDIYMPMTNELRIFGVPIRGYRIAIDSPERYYQAIRDVQDGKVDFPWSTQCLS
jgi:NDP-sugar pyrophosphorylase family protein